MNAGFKKIIGVNDTIELMCAFEIGYQPIVMLEQGIYFNVPVFFTNQTSGVMHWGFNYDV